jgi:hypothetical protein
MEEKEEKEEEEEEEEEENDFYEIKRRLSISFMNPFKSHGGFMRFKSSSGSTSFI